MSRFFNFVLFTILLSSIYTTFSVKNDVAVLAQKNKILTRKILAEKEIINTYKTEWALLSSPSNVNKLQKKLMPNLQVISVAQMQNIVNTEAKQQFASNNLINFSYKITQKN